MRASDVLFTQTPGSKPVLQLDWLKPHATIIASGAFLFLVVSCGLRVRLR